MRQKVHEVCRILTWKNSPSLEQNARVKLHIHETKLCICSAWFLMHLSFHGIKEHCVDDGLTIRRSWVVYFLRCKGLVDNKYSRNAWRICYRPEISCSHPCFKGNWLWRFESMDPYMLAIIYLIFFSRDIFFKQRVFSIYCSPNFYHFSKTQTRPRLNCTNKTQGHLVECTKCTFETRLMPPLYVVQILLFETPLSLDLSPAWTWGFYSTNLKSFLLGFIQKDIHPKFTLVLLQSSLTKIWLKKAF